MPRTIELNVSSDASDQVIAAVRDSGAVITLAVQRGASLVPPGDVLSIRVTNDGALTLVERLRSLGFAGVMATATADVASLVHPPRKERLQQEASDSTWSEIAFFIRGESNLMLSYVAFMFLAGSIAAAGLWKDAPTLVIGAMLIAPAMVPLLRIPFGLVGRDPAMALGGGLSTLVGYAAVIGGAVLTTVLLRVVDPLPWELFRSQTWVAFWSTLTPTAVVVAVVAAAAGALALSTRRQIPLAGVLIALDLVPAAGMAGMSLVARDMQFALQCLGRAAVDATIVLVVGGAVLAAKRSWMTHGVAASGPEEG